MSDWRAVWQLGNPGWLWALSALAVPIVIHLISRGTARRVSMGSIGLLRPRESRRARRVRPTELVLLLLRCLLLAVLALTLAGLVLTRPSAGEPVWGLISAAVAAEQAAGQLDSATTARLNALRAAGQLRRLAPGLPVDRDDAPPASVAADAADNMELAVPEEDVWSYLREAESVAPAGTRLEVFAHDRLSHLRGARPTIATPVSWAALTPVTRETDTATASPPSSPPSASSQRIVLRHATDRADDASYVVAALRAVTEVSRVEIDTAEIDAAEIGVEIAEPGSEANLGYVLVWLGDEPIPDAWRDAVSAGATLLRDQGGRWSPCATSVTGDAPGASVWHEGPPVRFQRARCLESPPEGWTVDANADDTPVSTVRTVWRDAHDRPVLTRQRVGDGAAWTLAGRFHPAWATLVLSPSFPRWVAAWLGGARPGSARPGGASDSAASVAHPAGEQRLPRRLESASDRATSPAWTRPPDGAPSPLWWVIVVLVVIERAVALRVGR